MIINEKKTWQFKESHRLHRNFSVFKIVRKNEGKQKTSCYFSPYTGGLVIPLTMLLPENPLKVKKIPGPNNKILTDIVDGAISVYSSKENAVRNLDYLTEKKKFLIIYCVALMSDFLAVGQFFGSLYFRKIFITDRFV